MVKEPKQPPEPKDPTKEFLDEYNALCEKHKLQISVSPAFKQRDDGTFSVVVQVGLRRLSANMK